MSEKKTGRLKPGPPPHKDGPYVIVALNVREKMKEQIEAAAKRRGKSVSAFVRDIIAGSLRRRR